MNILVKIMPVTTRVPLRCSVIGMQKNITISAFNAKILKKKYKSAWHYGTFERLFGTMVRHSIYSCDSLKYCYVSRQL